MAFIRPGRSSDAAPAPPPESEDITPSFTVTRTSGPTPLLVVCDAFGTTCSVPDVTDPWRQIYYQWDYGDSGSGNWPVTGNSKNVSNGGPVGGHVYDEGSEGARTITLTVTLGYSWLTGHLWVINDFVTQGGATYKCLVEHTSGTFATDLAASRWVLHSAGLVQSSATQAITVQNADTVYAGTLTVCIDSTGATGWGKASCAYATVLPTTQADDTRYIWRRGNVTPYPSFTVNRLRKRTQYMSMGSGAAVFSNSTYIRLSDDSAPSGIDKSFPEDIVIADLDLRGGLRTYNSGKYQLVLRNRFDAVSSVADGGVQTGRGRSFYAAPENLSSGWADTDFYYHYGCGFVSNEFISDVTNGFDSGMFGDRGELFVSLGNTHQGAETGSHAMRITHGYKVLVENEEINGKIGTSGGSGHLIKLHGSGSETSQVYAYTATPQTQYVFIQNNEFGGPADSTDWAVSIAPESTSDANDHQQTDSVIVLNNLFDQSAINGYEIHAGASNIFCYSNTRVDAGAMRVDAQPNAASSGYDVVVNHGPYFGQV